MVAVMREMKDSEVQWIGKIPESWKVTKNKFLLTGSYSGGTPRSGSELFYSDEGLPFISIADMSTVDIVESTVKCVTKAGIADKNLQIVPSGSVIYSMYATIGHVAETKMDSTISQALIALYINKKYNKNYYKYNLISMRDFILSDAAGTTQMNLNAQKVFEMSFVEPPLQEQNKISTFLDSKCSEIDSLAADIQTQIDTLEQYKRSVITEAVTKGLDKNVPMKDSNVEWIGEIPESWSVSKLGNVLHLRSERNYKPLEDVNLISLYTDKGVVQHSDLEKTSGNIAQNADGYKIVHKNDIVVNIILAWMGAMGISKYDGVTSPAYDVYEINQNKIIPHYCHYILRSPAMAGECYKYGRGIMLMRWRTYSTEFKKIKMPLPSLHEQQLIADYLDNKCAEIDSIITDKQKQLEILDEYKKSLIYEYVTGKKEVPNE